MWGNELMFEFQVVAIFNKLSSLLHIWAVFKEQLLLSGLPCLSMPHPLVTLTHRVERHAVLNQDQQNKKQVAVFGEYIKLLNRYHHLMITCQQPGLKVWHFCVSM